MARPLLPGGAPADAPVAMPAVSVAPAPAPPQETAAPVPAAPPAPVAELPAPAPVEAPAEAPTAQAPVAEAPAPVSSAPTPPPAPQAERALEGVKTGAFLPLEKLTAMLRERFPGEVLGVKLDQDDGVTYYEFKILTKAGRVMEIELDPRTGRVLDVDEDD